MLTEIRVNGSEVVGGWNSVESGAHITYNISLNNRWRERDLDMEVIIQFLFQNR